MANEKRIKKKRKRKINGGEMYIYISFCGKKNISFGGKNKERKKGSKKKEINVARCLAGGPSS